jgi:hypothetical protein
MLVPSTKADLLRQTELVLRDKDYPFNKKLNLFWQLLKPNLSWIKKSFIQDYRLEPEEADSEIYLFCNRLLKKYNPEKSSIIPYLSKMTEWEFNNYKRILDKKYSIKDVFVKKEGYYNLEEEYYWSEKILFETKWLKNFSKSDKYLIYLVLSCDQGTTQEKLAKKANISRESLSKKLKQIGGIYANS